MGLDVRAKRVYDPPESGDGARVLIDHVWPRGVSRTRQAGRLGARTGTERRAAQVLREGGWSAGSTSAAPQRRAPR